MVIVPDAFIASAPEGILAASLDPQTRHFNLAETRHLNFGLTSKMVILGTSGIVLRRFVLQLFPLFIAGKLSTGAAIR
jgi:hypothetical protein